MTTRRARKVSSDSSQLRTGMLRSNAVSSAWRLNYIANFYTVPFYLALDRRIGITRAEYVILYCVAQHPGTTAQEIVAASGRPKNSLSIAVAKLERKRLITRRQNGDDGRRMELRVTAAGMSVYRKVVPLLRERQRRMLAVLTAAERKRFDALLLKIADNVTTWQEPDLSSLAPARRYA